MTKFFKAGMAITASFLVAGCAANGPQTSEIGEQSGATKQYVSGGKLLAVDSDEAKRVKAIFTENHRRDHCKARTLIEAAVPALEAHSAFPLANNQPPAADFVSGFIKIRFVDAKLEAIPPEYRGIWNALTGDGDKALSELERNDAVRLWKSARSKFSFTCPRPPRPT